MTSEEEMQQRQEAFSNAKDVVMVMRHWLSVQEDNGIPDEIKQTFDEEKDNIINEITLILLDLRPEQSSQNGATDEPHE